MRQDHKTEPTDKPPMSLVAWDQLAGEAWVWKHGIDKGRAPDNWRGATDHRKYRNSLARHVAEYLAGAELDDDSGLPILDHIICNCRILRDMDKRGVPRESENSNG